MRWLRVGCGLWGRLFVGFVLVVVGLLCGLRRWLCRCFGLFEWLLFLLFLWLLFVVVLFGGRGRGSCGWGLACWFLCLFCLWM